MLWTYFIMLREEIVRNGYSCGAMDDVDKPVCGTSKIAMIDPYIGGSEYVDGISVGAAAVAEVGRGIPDNTRIPGLTIMDTYAMYDHMANMLYSYAGPIAYLHFSPSPINGFVTIYHELILELDNHAPSKNNPQGSRLDHPVTERTRLRVTHVVRRVGNDVNAPVLATDRVPAKTHRAVGEGAAVGSPVRLWSPTWIYGVHDFGGGFVAIFWED